MAGLSSPAGLGGSHLQRLGMGLLRQMQWMVPQRQQALRPAKVAGFVAAPELMWDWAQPTGGAAVLSAWLTGETAPAVVAPARPW